MTLRELLYEYGDRFKIFLNHIKDFIEQFSMVLQCNTSILDIPLKNVFIMLFCILYFFMSLWDGYTAAQVAYNRENNGQYYTLTIAAAFLATLYDWFTFAILASVVLILVYPFIMVLAIL